MNVTTDLDLTERQLEAVQLIAEGHTDRQTAAAMGVTVTTVRRHVELARWKVDARNRVHLVAIAVRRGWA